MSARIAVTGIGCLCAQGGNGPDIMEAIDHRPVLPRPPSTFTTPLREYPVFDVERTAERFLDVPLDPERFTRCVRMAAQALEEALRAADLAPGDLKGRRVAIVMGTTAGVTLSDAEYCKDYYAGRSPATGPYARFLRSNPSLALTRILDIPAIPFTVVNACASSTDAVGLGRTLLQAGMADVAVTGGTDEVCEVNHTGFVSLLIHSKGPCRPFDLHRDGLNLGSGAAVLILEREAEAQRRGARPEVFLTGYGTFADGHHMTAPHPEGRGLRKAVAKALAESGIGPGDLAFVNAHGTATKDNDLVEGSVFADLLAPGTPVVSTKGYTGHTLGAAGAIEAAISLYALKRGMLMKSAGFEVFDASCGISPSREPLALDKDYFMSTSLGFGGSNAALVFSRGRS